MAPPHQLFHATGVPLLEELSVLPLRAAAAKSLWLVAAATTASYVASKLVLFLEKKAEEVATYDGEENVPWLEQATRAAILAAHRPAAVLFPWLTTCYSLTVVSAFCEVAMARLDKQLHAYLHVCGEQALAVIKVVTQALQDTTELTLIIFAAWFAIRLKNRLVDVVVKTSCADGDESASYPVRQQREMSRALLPLSSLVSWAIVCVATIAALSTYGVDVRPLLAFGGAGTLAVGFAAQSTMSNVVAALSLYTTRPFVTGDRVQLRTPSGALVAAGTVASIKPMRTNLTGDNKLPIYIMNKDVANLAIVNETRRLHEAPVAAPLVALEMQIVLRYQDVDKVPAIADDVTEYLKSHSAVDSRVGGARCSLVGFSDRGPELLLKASLTRIASAHASAIRQEMLLAAERIVRSHGALLAITDSLGNPVAPPPAAAT